MTRTDRAVKAGGAGVLAALLAAASASGCGVRSEILGTVDTLTLPRFAAPALVAALSDPDALDEDPTLTGDLLELHFMSTRAGGAGGRDLWVSRRAAAGEPWGAPAPVPELSSSGDDWAPCTSLDGLRIWFATDRAGGGQARIWAATRPSRSAPWGAPAPVAEVASASADFAPAVDAAETSLYFASNRPGGAGPAGGYDLYASTRPSPGAPWAPPAAVPGVNAASDEYDPFVAQGGLVLFFTSMRSGAGDVYWTARRSTDEPFAAPLRLDDVDSDEYDSDATLSPDLTLLMFSSTRSGNAEIYEARAAR